MDVQHTGVNAESLAQSQRFRLLRRMQSRRLDDEAPGNARWLAPQFSVDEVGTAHRKYADSWERREKVEHIDDAAFLASCEQELRDDDPDQAAMEGHAPFPDAKQHRRVIDQSLEAVEQYPTQATAEDDAQG